MYVAMTSTAGRPRGVLVTSVVDGTEYESDDGMCTARASLSGDDSCEPPPVVPSVVAVDAVETRRPPGRACLSKPKTALTLSRHLT